MKQVIIDSEGKLCRPIYPECLFVDSTPRKGSMNPISSDAVFNAVGGATELPSYGESNEGQILKVKNDASGVEWADETTVTVDQVYDGTSENPQSGVAVAEALATIEQLPAFDTTTDLNKVLQVTADGLAWVSLN